MQKHKRLLFAGVGILALVAALSAGFLATRTKAHAAGNGTTSYNTLQVLLNDTIIPSGGTSSKGTSADQVRPEKNISPQVPLHTSKPLPPPPTTNPNPTGLAVTSSNTGVTGFNGLSHFDQRNAGTGIYTNTQFTLEPPDQGLCVGRGFVMESVNNALAVYSAKTGAILSGPAANSQFLGLAPEIDRTTGVFGPFVSDPKCLYDAQTGRWFFTLLMEDNGTNPGATGRTFTVIAVSKTNDPTKDWAVFKIDATDDGLNGTPAHAGCPCFGDQPLIGADNYGFYISTNEFGAGFNGAQLYAVSKWRLAFAAATGGSLPVVEHIDASGFLASFGGLSYSVQPAVSPSGGWHEDDHNDQGNFRGIEYFTSALQFGNPGYEVLDNRVAVWALTNTASLFNAVPNLTLNLNVIGSETYGQPNNMTQKDGPAASKPLAVAVNGGALGQIQSNDDRMNQLVYSNGILWSALNTIIGDGTRTGIAYFGIHPNWNHGALTAHMVNQGYVSVAGNNVVYPSIAVNGEGKGVISFSLIGPDYYPSAAYVTVGEDGAGNKVHIIGAGAGPDDGFTAYPAFGGNGAGRWGDYSAAVVSTDGSIWFANEYIPATPRTALANWGTFISHLSTDN